MTLTTGDEEIAIDWETWGGSTESPETLLHIRVKQEVGHDSRIGINVPNPQHAVHIRLDNGTEITDEHIRRWAKDEPYGFVMGDEFEIMMYLSQIIVEKVL